MLHSALSVGSLMSMMLDEGRAQQPGAALQAKAVDANAI